MPYLVEIIQGPCRHCPRGQHTHEVVDQLHQFNQIPKSKESNRIKRSQKCNFKQYNFKKASKEQERQQIQVEDLIVRYIKNNEQRKNENKKFKPRSNAFPYQCKTSRKRSLVRKTFSPSQNIPTRDNYDYRLRSPCQAYSPRQQPYYKKQTQVRDLTLQELRKRSRYLPNTSIKKYFNRQVFQNYGRANISNNADGFINKNYLKSHNVNPHSGANLPNSQQTYLHALLHAKPQKLAGLTHRQLRCFIDTEGTHILSPREKLIEADNILSKTPNNFGHLLEDNLRMQNKIQEFAHKRIKSSANFKTQQDSNNVWEYRTPKEQKQSQERRSTESKKYKAKNKDYTVGLDFDYLQNIGICSKQESQGESQIPIKSKIQ